MQIYCVPRASIFERKYSLCFNFWSDFFLLQRYLPTTILPKVTFYQEKKIYIGCNFLHEIFCLYYIKFSNVLCYILFRQDVITLSLYVSFTRVRMGQFRCNRLHKFWRFYEKRQVFVNVLEDLGTKDGSVGSNGSVVVRCGVKARYALRYSGEN